jgi:hypothetical protein
MPYREKPSSVRVTRRHFCDISNYGKTAKTRFPYQEETMKTLLRGVVFWVVFFVAGTLPVWSQGQDIEGYTFIQGASGGLVCLGTWTPSRDVAMPGTCDGPLVDVAQLTALSSRQSADRLDHLVSAFASIDQRLAAGNAQLERLIEVTVNNQASLDQQVRQAGEALGDAISRRFDEMPEEMLANDLFKESLEKLKEDILKEVDRRYLPRPAPAKKK